MRFHRKHSVATRGVGGYFSDTHGEGEPMAREETDEIRSDPSDDSVVATSEGAVCLIRLNRPQRLNALNAAAIALLRRKLIAFRDDADQRVCVITGAGERGFCTGADLKETLPPSAAFAASVFEPDAMSIAHGNYIRGLDLERLQIGKPLIAAINGHAVGGGLELALACDIRLAVGTARFGLPEVKVGSIPAVGGIQRLMRSVPHTAAMTMILTGETIDATQAEAIGLISEVLSSTDLMPRAMDLARSIAENAPLAVQAARMLALSGFDMTISQAMLLEQFVWGVLRDTEDRIEGRQAFAEHRQPVFRRR